MKWESWGSYEAKFPKDISSKKRCGWTDLITAVKMIEVVNSAVGIEGRRD